MRRSKAPSALNKAKRICNFVNSGKDTELETGGSEPEDEQYKWGTKDHNFGEKVLTNQHKRIFNIVWRDVSNKKHKTWKGDGIIEVNLNTMKAILKDDTGKYMGCSTKFNVHDLEPDFQMVISGKEIELQNEVKDEEEIYNLHKRRIRVNWGAEETVPLDKQAEEERKPKGGFKFKPVLILKQPELPKNSDISVRKQENCETNASRYLPSGYSVNLATKDNSNCPIKSNLARSTANVKLKEFICFIKPSELQQFLFQQVLDYLDPSKNHFNIETVSSLDFKNVLRQICNHPSFVNYKSTTNELIHHLIPSLPEWSEMGPFDSGKLEYLQYFLQASSKLTHVSCIILAKNRNTLNMLQGLTDYMDIKSLRVNSDLSSEERTTILNEFTTNNDHMQVLLINSMETLKNISPNSRCTKLIVFEDVAENIRILQTWEKLQDVAVYYLVTAFSIEELLILNDYNTESYSNNLLLELGNLSTADDDVCYVHTKIECKCFETNYELTNYNKDIQFLNNWQHCNNPFDDEFLKVFFLGNVPENIVTIFYKTSF